MKSWSGRRLSSQCCISAFSLARIWFLSSAVRAEQSAGGEEHAAAEPSAGLRSAAGPSGHADCRSRDCFGERCRMTLNLTLRYSNTNRCLKLQIRSCSSFARYLIIYTENAPPSSYCPASDSQWARWSAAACQSTSCTAHCASRSATACGE